MTEKSNPLRVALYAGKITREQFLLEYFKHAPRTDDYVLDLLEKGVVNEDENIIEEGMTLLFTEAFSMKLFAAILCRLLPLKCHTRHEDIAMLLKEIADPGTVNCLYEATELSFGYLEYDDTYQFARKCIKALSAIGNEEAANRLKLLSGSAVVEIAGYAKKELRYLGLEA